MSTPRIDQVAELVNRKHVKTAQKMKAGGQAIAGLEPDLEIDGKKLHLRKSSHDTAQLVTGHAFFVELGIEIAYGEICKNYARQSMELRWFGEQDLLQIP